MMHTNRNLHSHKYTGTELERVCKQNLQNQELDGSGRGGSCPSTVMNVIPVEKVQTDWQ